MLLKRNTERTGRIEPSAEGVGDSLRRLLLFESLRNQGRASLILFGTTSPAYTTGNRSFLATFYEYAGTVDNGIGRLPL